MKGGDGGDQQEMKDAGEEAHQRAVFIHDGGHAVGVAGTDQDGLGVDGVGEVASGHTGKMGHDGGGHHVAQQHGPGV